MTQIRESSTLRTERLIGAYDRLDKLMRSRLTKNHHMGHVAMIAEFERKFSLIRRNVTFMKRIAELRNLVVHDPERPNSYPIAIPSDGILERYEKIIEQIEREPFALDRCIRKHDVFAAEWSSSIFDVSSVMVKNGYSQVPILEGGVVHGVFSESIFCAIMADRGDIITDGKDTLYTIKEYLSLQRHGNEHFEFVGKNMRWSDVESKFAECRHTRQRIGALFVTENGRHGESMLGLITPWDLPEYSPEE